MEKAMIFSGPVCLIGPGRPVTLNNVGAALHYLNGVTESLTRDNAEVLLNDGLLGRLRIRIKIGGK